MAYEFKKLSEVEAIETLSETSNVLIEDGGSIKRVPSSAVGGNSGGIAEEYDMILKMSCSGTYINNNLNTDSIIIEKGIPSEIVSKMKSGTLVKAIIKLEHTYDVLYTKYITPLEISVSAHSTNSLQVEWIMSSASSGTTPYTRLLYNALITDSGVTSLVYKTITVS